MVFMRLVCYIYEEDFSAIACLNRARNEESHNEILCRVINILEKHKLNEVGELVVQMLLKNPKDRIHLDKVLPLLKMEQA